MNKHAPHFKAATAASALEDSFKWSLKDLERVYGQMGISYGMVMDRVRDVVIKAVISVEPIIGAGRNRRMCFELYGFDVLIDSDLRPWLLEVNVLPSFSASAPLDKRIKTSLLADVFNTIGVVPSSSKKKVTGEGEKVVGKIRNGKEMKGDNWIY